MKWHKLIITNGILPNIIEKIAEQLLTTTPHEERIAMAIFFSLSSEERDIFYISPILAEKIIPLFSASYKIQECDKPADCTVGLRMGDTNGAHQLIKFGLDDCEAEMTEMGYI